MPEFLDDLSLALSALGVALTRPLPPLGDDGELAGLGEEVARGGAFRKIRNAYYLGAGTGLAEALKLEGRLVSLDSVSSWFPRAWRLGFEEDLCAAALRDGFRRTSRRPAADLLEFQQASRGVDPAAFEALHLVGRRLLALVQDRQERLGSRLQRLVLGQRFCGFPASPLLDPIVEHYGPDFALLSDFLEAPAVGAAVLVLQAPDV